MSLQAAKVERPAATGARLPPSPDEQKRRFKDLCETLEGDTIEKTVVVPLKPRAKQDKFGAE